MSSPINCALIKDTTGAWRLHLTGYSLEPFKATDLRFMRGKDFSKDMLKIADPAVRLSDEEAIECLDAARKYYSPTKKR